MHRLRRQLGCPALVPDVLLSTEWSTPVNGRGPRVPPEQRIDSYLRLGVAAYNKDSKSAHYAWQNARRFDPYGRVNDSARDYLQQPKLALLQ